VTKRDADKPSVTHSNLRYASLRQRGRNGRGARNSDGFDYRGHRWIGESRGSLAGRNGYRVFAAGRSAEKRARLEALANEQKLSLETLEMEVCDDRSVQQAVNLVYQKAGTIDVLINNAGLAYVATVEDMTMEDWRRQFETNFFGVVARDPGGAPQNARAALRSHHHDQLGLRTRDPADAGRL